MLNMFFQRCSYKNSCFSELGYNSSVLCANLMIYSLRFKKYVLILKMLPFFGFCAFGFEAIPHSSYLTSMLDKSNHGLVIAHFFVQLLQLFFAPPEMS